MLPKLGGNLLSVVILALFVTNAVLAKHSVTQRLESIENDIKPPKPHEDNFLEKLEWFSLITANQTRGETIVGLLKLFTIAKYYIKFDQYVGDSFTSAFVVAIKRLIVGEPMKGVAAYAKYPIETITLIKNSKIVIDELLDWHTLFESITLLGSRQVDEDNEIEWICFAIMVAIEGILESSTKKIEFEYTFTDQMMYNLNFVRVKANSIWAIHSYNKLGDTSLPIRFKFDVFISKSKLSIRTGKSLQTLEKQLKRDVVGDAVEFLIGDHLRSYEPNKRKINFGPYLERVALISYYAFIELNNDELLCQSYELANAMELYNLISKTSIVSKCYAKLNSLIDSPAYKNVKSEYTKQVNEFTTALNAMTRMNNKEKRTNPKYLEYLAIAYNLTITKDKNKDVNQAFYLATEDILDDQVLNNDQKLLEFYQCHSKLYEVAQNGISDEWTKDKMGKQLLKILKIAGGIVEKKTLSAGDPNKIHILSSLGLQLSRKYFSNFAQNISAEMKNMIIRVLSLIYIRAKDFKSKLNLNDWVALKEWYVFTRYHKMDVANELTREWIARILGLINSILNKPISTADVSYYNFFARLASLLCENGQKAEAIVLSEKVFELELRIYKLLETEIADRLVWKFFVTERELFYIYFASDALRYTKHFDLKHLIEHHIETITSLDTFDDFVRDKYDVGYPIMAKYQLLKSIFDATETDASADKVLKDSKICAIISQIYVVYLKETAASEFSKTYSLPTGKKVKKYFGAREK